MSGSQSRHRLAARLSGAGIEIGASNNPVPVPEGARVTYVDKFPSAITRTLNPDIPEDQPLVDVALLAEAENLGPLPDGSQDFVIASHVLEHVPDPIRALVEFHRVIKPGGRLYLCLPDMRGTFDRERERTRLPHLLADFREGAGHPARAARDRAHFLEWARVVNALSDPRQAAFFGDMLRRARYPIHFHCWQPDDLVELFDRLRGETRTPFRVLDADLPEAQDEFAFLLERDAQ